MAKIAVVLSGAGVYDGSELHESILTMMHLDQHGAEMTFFAPDKNQMHVINHQEGAPAEGESRNVRIEAARIARGPVEDLATLKASDYDALVIPGGFGAAKNLCTFAVDGPDCSVNEAAKDAILDFFKAGKPLAPMCIAPALVAKVLGGEGTKVKLTIGTDADTAAAIEKMGAEHVNCHVDDCVVDTEHKVISTPAYMLGPSIKDIEKGIGKLVAKVMEMV